MSRSGGRIERPVDEEIVQICAEIRKELEDKVGTTFSEYTPLSAQTQVVAGVNFFVKIDVGEGECYNVTILRPLSGAPQLTSYERESK